MTTPDPRLLRPLLRRWQQSVHAVRRLATSAADEVQQRASPRTAIMTLTGAGVLSLAMVLTAAAWSAPQSSPSRWVNSVANEQPPESVPAPAHEPLRPLAVQPQRSPTPAPPPPPPPLPPVGDGDEFVTWAVMDLATGSITASGNATATSTTASMIKVWLVADYLRRAESAPDSSRLSELSTIVRDSNNPLAQELFEELGEEASIHRLIDICGLTDSHAVPGSWSSTRLSGRDTARMGACIADGRAAGPGQWTDWLLSEMRQVRGVGDFGIRDALPPGQRSSVAIKNGWVIRDDANEWHVNCLAIGDGWSMGVLTRYPAEVGYPGHGYRQGAEICRSLAAEHLPLG